MLTDTKLLSSANNRIPRIKSSQSTALAETIPNRAKNVTASVGVNCSAF